MSSTVRNYQSQMNGKKYKVTIRVVDHPPRYCDEWNKQQKMKEINQDHDKGKVIAPLTEVKPVLESHVSLGDPDNMSRLNGIDFTREVTPRDYIRRATKANDRPSDSHMKGSSDFDSHTLVSQPHNENRRRREQKGKPLEPTKSTSLNIYKLKRSNVIEDHNNDCFGEDRVSLGAALGEVLETSNNRQPKSQGAGLSYLNNGSSAKVGFGTGKNGFHVGVPVVILSSAKDSQKAELNSLPMNATANSVQDGLSSDLFAADSFKRPLLNREGSVCSSDSIITEIEGLTDDENVDEPCGKVTQSEDDPNEQVRFIVV